MVTTVKWYSASFWYIGAPQEKIKDTWWYREPPGHFVKCSLRPSIKRGGSTAFYNPVASNDNGNITLHRSLSCAPYVAGKKMEGIPVHAHAICGRYRIQISHPPALCNSTEPRSTGWSGRGTRAILQTSLSAGPGPTCWLFSEAPLHGSKLQRTLVM